MDAKMITSGMKNFLVEGRIHFDKKIVTPDMRNFIENFFVVELVFFLLIQ